MESKHWYQSKTEIINGLVILGSVLNYFFGIEIDAELQASLAIIILAVINMFIRFKTNTAITR